MRKKKFYIEIVLMSISLIGIIITQKYWIEKAIDENEKRFEIHINQILKSVVDQIEQREISNFANLIIDNMDDIGKPSLKELANLFVINIDNKTQERFIYSHKLIEENFGNFSNILESYADTLNLKRLISKRSIISVNKNNPDNNSITIKNNIEKIGNLSEIEKAFYYTSYRDIANSIPINKRILPNELNFMLKRQFTNRGLSENFEFGILENNIETNIKSKSFKLTSKEMYSSILFADNDGYSPYSLVIIFNKSANYIFSSLFFISFLSISFTLIVILIYSITLYRLITQRRLSKIKTDFINNMTHEFKTPIATISLALDTLKSPKVYNHINNLKQYFEIISQENKRMYTQVENILKLSKIEKEKDTEINKVPLNIHKLINKAIGHVQLIVDDKKGKISTKLMASKIMVLGSEDYLINALINVLDNAIKYSNEELKITVSTENKTDSILIHIADAGIGMDKSVANKVFEKFYRESTGDIHDVKGHGLGLTYVKQIVDIHNGFIVVKSQKGIGSTFTIEIKNYLENEK